MRCLKKPINVTRRDRFKNDTIRTLIGTEPLQEYINRQQIKWFGHIIRMMPNETPSIAYTSKHSGRRARGRPRKRWIDGIKEILNTRNMTVTEATQLAHHRRLHLPSTPHVGNVGDLHFDVCARALGAKQLRAVQLRGADAVRPE